MLITFTDCLVIILSHHLNLSIIISIILNRTRSSLLLKRRLKQRNRFSVISRGNFFVSTSNLYNEAGKSFTADIVLIKLSPFAFAFILPNYLSLRADAPKEASAHQLEFAKIW